MQSDVGVGASRHAEWEPRQSRDRAADGDARPTESHDPGRRREGSGAL